MAGAGLVAAHAKDIAVVSNKSNGVADVSMSDLVKICKGQTTRWPKGKPVTLFSLNPASNEMRMVLGKVYGMSSDEVSALITTANHGRANHPAIIIVKSDRDLVEAVESTPGAVGLVDVYSITGGITVLRVESKLPLEAGYPLHGN
jgi:ABC-type phosphate transport system substrate-binding protein